jgi:SOS response associated peptidase (SRAP)
MCGRVFQSGGPLRYAIVEGMNVRDSRVSNYPPRWNGALSQELLVIRRHHQTGQVLLDPLRWGVIPYWCKDPTGGRKPIKCQGRDSRAAANISGGLSEEASCSELRLLNNLCGSSISIAPTGRRTRGIAHQLVYEGA